MTTDNTVYDSVENAYNKIQEFFDNYQFGAEHSAMILKHEELADLLDLLDILAIEEQSNNLNELHEKFKDIKEASAKVVEELNDVIDYIATAAKVVSGLDKILSKVTEIIV
ncbi:hypothetical protein [Sulfurimonas sp.]|uniref:hypothetical protein n=1 Tax=Sulfurimonas sp. TaxID=2022749 RepID=UPI0025F91B3F|nr:hypothetical protein [Sulfurimonas sp.]